MQGSIRQLLERGNVPFDTEYEDQPLLLSIPAPPSKADTVMNHTRQNGVVIMPRREVHDEYRKRGWASD